VLPLSAAVALLVGVVAEVDGRSARDQRGPLALESARAGRQAEDGHAAGNEVEHPCRIGFSFDDEPLERVEPASDDRAQPDGRLLGARFVGTAVERPVLDRRHRTRRAAAGEGERGAAVLAERQARVECDQRFQADPLRLAEAAEPLAELTVQPSERLQPLPLRRPVADRAWLLVLAFQPLVVHESLSSRFRSHST
jgi:hypothetical protein